jgi:Kef-type K+ transport system membrane component KefB
VTAELGYVNLLAVAVIAVVAPLVATALPIRVPAVVLEIVVGIAVGPSGLGWIEPDQPVAVLALVGLAFLLFLSGLEIDLRGLRGDLLRLPLAGFALTLVLGMALGFGADAIGWVRDPFFLAVALGATSLGIVAPLLKDAGRAAGPLGQFTLAGATIADFATILLLSLVFAEAEGGATSRIASLAIFVVVAIAFAFALGRAGRSMGIDRVLVRLQDSTAEIRVRIAVVIMLSFVALAAEVGLETILGAFVAGAVLALVDRDAMSHPNLGLKLEAIGFGFLVPVFFVTSGLRFDLRSLTDEPTAFLRVPVLLAALLLVRGLPAMLYRGRIGPSGAITAGLLQATSLPFIVTATQIGVEVGAVAPVTAAALVGAGLLSTVLFPSIALARLTRTDSDSPTRSPAASPTAVLADRPMGTQF